MNQIEVTDGGRLCFLRSVNLNIDGGVTIDFGRQEVIEKDEWILNIHSSFSQILCANFALRKLST